MRFFGQVSIILFYSIHIKKKYFEFGIICDKKTKTYRLIEMIYCVSYQMIQTNNIDEIHLSLQFTHNLRLRYTKKKIIFFGCFDI